jgi:DNA-binding transcriptional MerR regulator
MADPPGEAEYPIAAVSKLTGVSCHALRVWERRYGFPLPRRSASGHRRYGHEQVVALRRISELSRSGRSVAELIAEAREGAPTHAAKASGANRYPIEETACAADVAEFLDLMLAGELSAGELRFEQLTATLSDPDRVARIIAPAFTETGERWFRRRCTIYQERYISGFLRRKLDAMIEAARRANALPARTVVIGAVQGDRHEGGLLLSHLLLERAGWRVISLGVDLPVAEFVQGVAQLRPDALALSFVLSRNINKRFQELARIRDLPIFVGGRSILNYQSLARRHGLIPVAGAVTMAIPQMIVEFEAWKRAQEARG